MESAFASQATRVIPWRRLSWRKQTPPCIAMLQTSHHPSQERLYSISPTYSGYDRLQVFELPSIEHVHIVFRPWPHTATAFSLNMPRVTRAKLRAQAAAADGGPQNIHEDTGAVYTTATHEYDPFSTKDCARAPLIEIHNENNTPQPRSEWMEQDGSAQKTKESKRDNSDIENDKNITPTSDEKSLPKAEGEVLEDDGRTKRSSAAEFAVEESRQDDPLSESFQLPIDVARSTTPSGATAMGPNKTLDRSPGKKSIAVEQSAGRLPRFDSDEHSKMTLANQNADHKGEDSFGRSIKTRRASGGVVPREPVSNGHDLFTKDISNRSPSPYVTCIVDSIPAIDDLEEAIAQVTEELPRAVAESLQSTAEKSTPRARMATVTLKHPSSGSQASDKKITKASSSAKKSPPTRTTLLSTKAVPRNAAPRGSSAQPLRRPSTLIDTKSRSSTRSATSAAIGNQAGRASLTFTPSKRKTRTSLSTSKPGFVPAKSTKPPTKSNFTLPGVKIMAELKARRQERLDKEAETKAARKTAELDARPVPKAMAAGLGKGRIGPVLPRETATSRARLSLAAAKKDADCKENAASAEKKFVAVSGMGSMRGTSGGRKAVPTSQPRLSVMKTRAGPPAAESAAAAAAAKRGNESTMPANSSTVRRNSTIYPASSKARQSTLRLIASSGERPGLEGSSGSSGPSSTKAAMATTAITNGTSRGKDIFSRGKIAEDLKKEREEAAKKARAAAAGRGRAASREWREKQKRKTMTTIPEKEKVNESKDGGVKAVEGVKDPPTDSGVADQGKNVLAEDKD